MTAAKLKGRYEKLAVLGQGGMGVVYKAFDSELRREVALKTILDSQNQAALDLFQKECAILAALNHPNIVDIYDIGEFEDGGAKKPYFVMPLLHGVTLDRLIAKQPQRLTLERTVEIMVSVCRGLQAAHERGLVHRDMKPSNIFVLEDDSVKVIDFGIAHLIDQRTNSGLKGTPYYMSPEQLQLQTPTALSDIFSLGVVCFEMLARRRPFMATSHEEIAKAILHQVPQPVSDLNPAVNSLMSQVIHAAMAKQPWHRFASAKEFSDALQKALKNQPIERFDPTHTAPRMRKAQKALENSEYEFANEILRELEAEGYLQPEIRSLRQQIDSATRTKTVAQLLQSAKRRFDDEEYQLALAKVGEVLQLDASNPDALELKDLIESKRNTDQIQNWLRLANQHIEGNSFNMARQALQNVLRLKPTDTQALELMSEVDRKEQDYLAIRKEKEQLFQSAEEFWRNGEVSAALSKLERVMDLDRRAPETSAPERASAYQGLYNKVRSEHDGIASAYAEARKNVADHNYPAALAICDQYLEKFPGHALFQAVKFDIGEHERQDLSAFIAKVDRDVEAEPDPDKRVSILQAAVDKYPGERHLEQSLEMVTSRRDLVNGIVHRARNLEERGQYADAFGQMEILRTIYPQYPGLDYESKRLKKRVEDQSRIEAKARNVGQIDRALNGGNYSRALELVHSALTEYPDDAELASLERLASQGKERNAEAQQLLARGQQQFAENDADGGLELVRQANRLDEHNSVARAVLVDLLVRRATDLLREDWRAAEVLGREALDLDPTNPQAKSLRSSLADKKREENVSQILLQARERQAAGDLDGALTDVDQGLQSNPRDPRLAQLRETLMDSHRQLGKRHDLEQFKELTQRLGSETNAATRNSLWEMSQILVKKHSDDEQFQAVAKEAEQHWRTDHPQANVTVASDSTQAGATQLLDYPVVKKAPAPAKRRSERRIDPFLQPNVPVPQASGAAPPAGPFGTRPAPLPAAPAVTPPTAPPVKPAPSGPGLRERANKITALVISRDKDFWARADRAIGRWRTSAPTLLVRLWRLEILWLLIGFLAFAGILTLLIFWPKPARRIVPTVQQDVLARIEVNPPEAKIVWQGQPIANHQFKAPPNTHHEVVASLPGYQTKTVPIDIMSGMGAVKVSLTPLPQVMRLNVPDGYALFDDKPVVLNGVPIALADGAHTLRLQTKPAGGLYVKFESQPGKMPAVTEIGRSDGIWATVVTNLENVSRVYGPPKAGLNGQLLDVTPATGLELTNSSGGVAELTVLEDGQPRHMQTEFGSAPSVTVTVLDANRAQLVVTSTTEGGTVFIDDQQMKLPIRNGKFQTTAFKPGGHRVRVEMEGFQSAGKEVALTKGNSTPIEINLNPLQKFSSLVISGAVEGAEVRVDDNPIGTVPQSGSIETRGIQPGAHKIRLRKTYYEPKELSREFTADKPVLLSRADVALLKWAQVNITVKPDVPMTIQYSNLDDKGSSAARVENGVAHVRDGNYRFDVAAAGYKPDSQITRAQWGGDVHLEFTLTAIPKQVPIREPLPAVRLEGFERKPAPSSEGWDVFDRDVLFNSKPDGFFTFDLKKSGGKFIRKFPQIGLGCSGSRCLLMFDPGVGKKSDEVHISMTASERGCSIRITKPDGTYQESQRQVNLSEGKFGLFGKEINVRNFEFQPAIK